MEPETITAWGAAFAGVITTIGLAVWGVLQKIKADRLKLTTEENAANAELMNRIKADSAERERQKQQELKEHYQDMMKELKESFKKRFDEMGKQVKEALEMANRARETHMECEKNLATQTQRVSDLERWGEEKDRVIGELESRIATLEGRHE